MTNFREIRLEAGQAIRVALPFSEVRIDAGLTMADKTRADVVSIERAAEINVKKNGKNLLVNIPPDVVRPGWMTPEQQEAVHKLYERDSDGASSFYVFFQRVQPHIGNFCGLSWCGMFVGIEPNGYTHT